MTQDTKDTKDTEEVEYIEVEELESPEKKGNDGFAIDMLQGFEMDMSLAPSF